MSKQSQSGLSHVVIVGAIVVVLAGALGFVFWQQSNNNGEKASTASQEPAKVSSEPMKSESVNSTLTTDTLSFEYPSKGWKRADPQVDTELARLETDDYVHSQGMGLDAGASVSVFTSEQTQVPTEFGAKDVKEVTIDGAKGYGYTLEYEGYRLQAFFAKSGKTYVVTMETATTATSEQKKVFDQVLSTLSVK